MIKHLFSRITLALLFLILLGGIQPVTAQTPEPPKEEYPCADETLSRYEAWVKALPCRPVLSTGDAPPTNSSGENTDTLGGLSFGNLFKPEYVDMVFSSYRDENWEIYGSDRPWISSGLGNALRMTNDPATDLMPRLRPGSTQIVFTSNRTGNWELFLMDWGGGNLQQITAHAAYDSQPAWSPDGSRLAFVSDRDGSLEIYTMNADGSAMTRLTFDGMDDFDPYWSTDGSKIIWVRAINQEFGAIFMMDANGQNQYQVTPPLRYLEYPSWSRVSDQIAFDYDGNLDGWNDLGVMNVDGGDLHTVLAGKQRIDYWAGPWTQLNPYDFLFTEVYYIVYQGILYIESMEVGSVSTRSGINTFLSSSSPDVFPDVALIDITAPQTFIKKLPEYQRANPFQVTIVGYDPGLAIIANIYIEERLRKDKPWGISRVFSGINASKTEQSYEFPSLPGQTVYLRSMGLDYAENLEIPPEEGDTFTHLFSWNLWGSVTDNRGVAIPHALANTQPVFTDQANPNSQGMFHRYVPSSPVTATIQASGYPDPLPSRISSLNDQLIPWALSSQDDVLANGNFENGLESWLDSGDYAARLATDAQHSGSAAAELGQALTVTNIVDISTKVYGSEMPKVLMDANGVAHAIWTGTYTGVGNVIHYSSKTPTGTWTAPIFFFYNHRYDSYYPDLTLGPDGRVHAVWLDFPWGQLVVQYAVREIDGAWSDPVYISGSRRMNYEPYKPEIAVDSQNTVHVVWGDADGLQYIQKPAGGTWSAPRQITSDIGSYAMALGPDDRLHFVYASEGITYTTRSADGVWNSMELISSAAVTNIKLAADVRGVFHLLGKQGYEVYYAQKLPQGAWSALRKISSQDQVYEIELKVDGNNAFAMWRCEGGLKYTRQYDGVTWSPPLFIIRKMVYPGFSFLAREDQIRVILTNIKADPFTRYEILTGELNISRMITSSLSQAVTIATALHNPTLSFHYNSSRVGTGGIFQALISDTVVYSSSAAATAWTHGWVDLSSWRGQTVTVTFQAQNDLSKGLLTTFIDDVSVGSWLTPMIYSVEPERIEPNTPFVLIIKGENFVNRPMVRLNGIEYSQAQWKDEHTLQLTLASGLDGGIYEVEVSNPGGQETIWSRRIQVGSFIYLPIQMR